MTELEHGPNIRKPSHLRVRSTLCFSLYYQYIQSRILAASVASRNARRPVPRARASYGEKSDIDKFPRKDFSRP